MTTRSGASWRQQIDSESDSEFDGDERRLTNDESDSDSDDGEYPIFPAIAEHFHFVSEETDVRPSVRPRFYGTPGLNPSKEISAQVESEDEKIRHFIDIIFTNDFFNTIAHWTNKRAELYFSSCYDQLSTREKRWYDTNSDEMKKFS